MGLMCDRRGLRLVTIGDRYPLSAIATRRVRHGTARGIGQEAEILVIHLPLVIARTTTCSEGHIIVHRNRNRSSRTNG